MLRSREKQKCERFETEKAETTRVYDEISAGTSFNVQPLGRDSDEEVVARLARAMTDPASWEMETLTAGGSYVSAPDRARECLEAVLPTVPRHGEVAVPAGAEASDAEDEDMESDDSLAAFDGK